MTDVDRTLVFIGIAHGRVSPETVAPGTLGLRVMYQRQVGWLGQTGRFYPIDTPTDQIHEGEKGGYTPVYTDDE